MLSRDNCIAIIQHLQEIQSKCLEGVKESEAMRIMHSAARSSKEAIALHGAKLRKYCAKPKQYTTTDIHRLLESLPNEELRTQVVQSANVNDKSAVHFSCQLGVDVSVLHLLLHHGADVNATTNRGHTPLIFAAGRGKNAHVNTLLNHNANPKVVTVKGDTACSMGKGKLEPETLQRLQAIAEAEDHPLVDFRAIPAANLAQAEHAKHCKYCRQGANELPAHEEKAVAQLAQRLEACIPDSTDTLSHVLIDFATRVTQSDVTHGFIYRVLKEGFIRVVTCPERFVTVTRVVSDEASLLALLEQNNRITGEDKRPVHLVLQAFCSALEELDFLRRMPVGHILHDTQCPFIALEAVRHFETLSVEEDTNAAALVQGVYGDAVTHWITGEDQEITRVVLRHKVSRKRGGIAEAKARKLLQLGLRIKELLVETAERSIEHCVGCARNGRAAVGHRLTARLESQRPVKRKEQVRKKKCPHFYEEEEWASLRQEEAAYDLEVERSFVDKHKWSLTLEETMLQVVEYANENNVLHHLKSLLTEKHYLLSTEFTSRLKDMSAPHCKKNPVSAMSQTYPIAQLPTLARQSQVRWLDNADAVHELVVLLSSMPDQVCPLGIDTEWTDNDTVAILQVSDGSNTWIVDFLPLWKDNPVEEYTNAVEELLRTVFHREELRPIGFSFNHDTDKLRHACSDLSLESCSVIDIQEVMMERIEQKDLISLKAACESILACTLDKTEQMSNWERRPLSQTQLDYAALDAEVLVTLHHNVIAASPPRVVFASKQSGDAAKLARSLEN